MIDFGKEVNLDLALMLTLPAVAAEEYNSMWAYRNHYRCLPDEESLSNETFDCRVFVMSPQGCQSSSQDRNVVDADLPYIGILKKMIVATYQTVPRTVMK